MSLFLLQPDHYFSGDGALVDEEGYYRITGRMDDVMNISGHRLGTAEIEDVMVGEINEVALWYLTASRLGMQQRGWVLWVMLNS